MDMLLYGPSGIGKTVLAASAIYDARLRPAICFSLEANTNSIRSKLQWVEAAAIDTADKMRAYTANLDTEKLHIVKMREWIDFIALLEVLEDTDCCGFKTVIIDSFTAAVDMNLRDVAERQHKRKVKPTQAPEIEHYCMNQVQVHQWLRRVRDLPAHTIMTAHEERDKDGASGSIKNMPTCVGQKLRDSIPYWVEFVGRMYVGENNKRMVDFRPTERIVANDHSEGGVLSHEEITLGPHDAPNLTKLYELAEKE